MHNLLCGETHELALPVQRHRLGFTVTVFRHDAFAAVAIRLLPRLVLAGILILAVQEQNDIRILLNRAGISQIRKNRTVIGTLLTVTGQLRQR